MSWLAVHLQARLVRQCAGRIGLVVNGLWNMEETGGGRGVEDWSPQQTPVQYRRIGFCMGVIDGVWTVAAKGGTAFRY